MVGTCTRGAFYKEIGNMGTRVKKTNLKIIEGVLNVRKSVDAALTIGREFFYTSEKPVLETDGGFS